MIAQKKITEINAMLDARDIKISAVQNCIVIMSDYSITENKKIEI